MKGMVAAGLLLLAAPAWAQDKPDKPSDVAQDMPHPPIERELCSDRPGLGTPACTVDPGRLQVELGIGDWTLERTADSRSDTIDAGEVSLRYGIGGTTELRLGWTAWGHVRTRDSASGAVDRTSGIGDVTIGLKQNLQHPAEGKGGLAVALLPFATLPSGHGQVGAGDWGAGMIVPMSYKLNDTIQFELVPEADAAVNDSGDGRHLAYGSVFGVQVHVTKTARLTPEIEVTRDRDPSGHTTQSRAALSFDVRPQKFTQLDVQATKGLNHDTPDWELSFGATRKF